MWWLELPWPCPGAEAALPFAATDWMVVSVVVSDRMDGAGLEKVLSPPLRDSTPPGTVRAVPAIELAWWLGAVVDCDPSWSVDTVPVTLRAPTVGGARPSIDVRLDRLTDVLLAV